MKNEEMDFTMKHMGNNMEFIHRRSGQCWDLRNKSERYAEILKAKLVCYN